ncbi:MAG TPA: radical SAM protein, partial [Spirochaetota bacterium]|nr:radical SAM protein [Spirochaetota bacterium]
LKSLNSGENISKFKKERFFSNNKLTDINDFMTEYSEISIDFTKDGLCYIETERGCPFSCSFCAYGKTRKDIGKLEFENFKAVFSNFIKKGANNFYILSPTLNRNRVDFNDYLKFIKNIKNQHNIDINLFGELKAELLTDDEIILLKDAGFSSIEFGIQSFNKKSLLFTNVNNKNFDLKIFTEKLLKNKIIPIIDFIIGLPDDTYENIIATIDFLSENNLLDYCNFYHLQLLPGTDIRKLFIEKNYNFQKKPPYFALETDSMTLKEIKNVYLYLEQEKDFSYRDDFFTEDKNRFFIIKNQSDFEELFKTKFYQTSSFIMVDSFETDYILNFFDTFFKNNSEIFHICYLYSEKELSKSFLEKLNYIFNKYRNYYDNYRESINYFDDESFSKIFKILCKSSVNKEYFNFLRDFYYADYIFFPEDSDLLNKNIKKLEKLYNDEDIETYVFYENKMKQQFLKVFPDKFN